MRGEGGKESRGRIRKEKEEKGDGGGRGGTKDREKRRVGIAWPEFMGE